MERRTYYTILGVSSTESASGIRAAYRDLVKRLHPDVAGEQSTREFQEVSEAYRVLSDPQRRRDYNHELKQTADGTGAVGRRPLEPIAREEVTVLRRREHTRPVECLDFEVLLTPDESAAGCMVPVHVPAFSPCPECGGSGGDWFFPCLYCRQRGTVEKEEQLYVRVPPMAPSGSVYEVLQGVGVHDVYLRLHVFVESGPG